MRTGAALRRGSINQRISPFSVCFEWDTQEKGLTKGEHQSKITRTVWVLEDGNDHASVMANLH